MGGETSSSTNCITGEMLNHTGTKRTPTPTNVLLVLGGIGVAVHAISLKWSIFQKPPADAWPVYGNQMVSLMHATTVVLAGLLYPLLLRWPVRESLRCRKISPLLVCTGGVLGAVVSTLAFQGGYLTGACFLTYEAVVHVSGASIKTAFQLALMEVEVYGFIETFYILVPAFFVAAVTTATVARIFSAREDVQVNSR
jgi:hypothetical protein